jgi:hypothetical protein
MGENKSAGVKERPAQDGTLHPAIDTVTHDGVPDGAQVEADLMLPSSVQFDFEKSAMRKSLPDFVVGDRVTGRLVLVSRDVPLAGLVFVGNRKVDGPEPGFGKALDQGEVAAQEGVISEGGPPRRVALPRESDGDETRCASIQPMKGAHIRSRPTDSGQIGAQAGQDAVVAGSAIGGNSEQSGRLVHHREMLVLEGAGKGQANRFFAPTVRVVGHGAGGLNPMARVPDSVRTHVDLACANRVLGLPSRQGEVSGYAHVEPIGRNHHPGE